MGGSFVVYDSAASRFCRENHVGCQGRGYRKGDRRRRYISGQVWVIFDKTPGWTLAFDALFIVGVAGVVNHAGWIYTFF